MLLLSARKTCAALALASAQLTGQSAAEASKLEFFEQRVRPVLASSCYECHSTHGKQRGGVVLDHRAGIRAEGSEGPIVAPGEPEESVLLMVTRHELEGLEMPEDGARLRDDVLAEKEETDRARHRHEDRHAHLLLERVCVALQVAGFRAPRHLRQADGTEGEDEDTTRS